MNLNNQNLDSRDQISATDAHSNIANKKDSLFRNSLDEYSAHVKLMPSHTASGSCFKRESDITAPFENTTGNQNFVKKEQCSESNHSYNPILMT